MIQVDKDGIQPSFDVVVLYPSIPIEKALDCIRKMILYRKEQKGNHMILSVYSKFALKLISRLWMTVFSHKRTEHPLKNRYQVL